MEEKKSVLKEFVAPIFVQMLVIVVCIAMHRYFINKGTLIGAEELVGNEMAHPTTGRLMYLAICGSLFLLLTIIASICSKNEKVWIPFILGTFAGTFLWQLVGEDVWHFTILGEHLLQVESISSLPIFVLFVVLLMYSCISNSIPWGVECMLLSFGVNWGGHYVLLNILPIVNKVIGAKIPMNYWGCGLGSVLFLLGIVLGTRKKASKKTSFIAAVLCFFAIGIIAFGMIES